MLADRNAGLEQGSVYRSSPHACVVDIVAVDPDEATRSATNRLAAASVRKEWS